MTMALVRFNPGVVDPVLNEWSNLINDFFGTEVASNKLMPRFSQPAVNIRETDDEFIMEVAAPGLEKNDFNVFVEDGVLHLEVNKEVEDKEEDKNWRRYEFNYMQFKRSFQLPESVDTQKVDATYKNGILNIHLPKKEEAKPIPPKSIKIK